MVLAAAGYFCEFTTADPDPRKLWQNSGDAACAVPPHASAADRVSAPMQLPATATFRDDTAGLLWSEHGSCSVVRACRSSIPDDVRQPTLRALHPRHKHSMDLVRQLQHLAGDEIFAGGCQSRS
jgi:hypothetical protein